MVFSLDGTNGQFLEAQDDKFVGLEQLTMTEFTVGIVALSSRMEANRKFHQEKQLL